MNLFLGSAELTRGADEGAAPDGGLPQPFELLVEFLVPRGVCTQTPRGLSEGWLAVPKEAADGKILLDGYITATGQLGDLGVPLRQGVVLPPSDI